MTSKHKVLDLIYELIKDIESDWTDSLKQINIWDDVRDIYYYNKVSDPMEANIILAFIVLAYDGNSTFLEVHKDRHDNKVKILRNLAGMNAMQNDLYNDVVFGFDKFMNTMINWYIDYQKDWRWKDIVAANEYHSTAMQMSMSGNTDPVVMHAIGKTRQLARSDKKIAEQMQNELRTEFLNLDTILEKEGKPKVTEVQEVDFMNHEAWLKADSKNKFELAMLELQRKQAEQDEKEALKEAKQEEKAALKQAKKDENSGLKIVRATMKKYGKSGKPSGNGDDDDDDRPF